MRAHRPGPPPGLRAGNRHGGVLEPMIVGQAIVAAEEPCGSKVAFCQTCTSASPPQHDTDSATYWDPQSGRNQAAPSLRLMICLTASSPLNNKRLKLSGNTVQFSPALVNVGRESILPSRPGAFIGPDSEVVAVVKYIKFESSAMYQNVVIYYNDSVDSDNLAAAMALMRAMETRPNTRLLWIVEPRQVSFGLSPTKEQQDECEKVVKKHFPTRGNPWKILFGGLLSESDLNGIEELSTHDRELLQLAVKPSYGPKQDAILHRRLTAWDQVTCMARWSKASVEILMDLESLDEIENPVNLNFHYKEELAARSVEELMSYQDIMNKPFAQRVESLRVWYRRCIERAETRPENHGSSVRPLDFNSLCDAIQTAGSVRFFGGASLTILQRFIQRGVASNVRCHLQVGSYDPSANLFPNQFNISLNPKAARFVFNHFTEFSDFAVVPSQAAQSTKYSLTGLKHEGGRCLERRVLGFNCHEDPLKIAEKQVTIEKDYPNQACTMPDLTAFLCALIPNFNGSTLGYAQVDDDDGALIFRRESSGIPMYDIMDNRTLKETEVVATLSSLAGGKDMPELVL